MLKSLLKEVEKVVEKEAFSDEASRVIEVFADVKVSRVQKGDGTMGTAFQEILKDQKEEGRAEGRLEGREEGREEGIESVVVTSLTRNKTCGEIADFNGLDLQYVIRVAKKHDLYKN
jgi:flagellar biosynthesis/type III secretory pathway protein FliH